MKLNADLHICNRWPTCTRTGLAVPAIRPLQLLCFIMQQHTLQHNTAHVIVMSYSALLYVCVCVCVYIHVVARTNSCMNMVL